MKIARIADIHFSGKNLAKGTEALRQVALKLEEVRPEIVVICEFFDRPNIADRNTSVGDIQRIAIDFVKPLTKFATVIFIPANHEKVGNKAHCLEFMRGMKNVRIVDTPSILEFGEVKIGCIPWIDKGIFTAKHCVGLQKSESDAKFTQAIHNLLGYFKAGFTEETTNFLFAHLEVQGTAINAGYTLQGGATFSFTAGQLGATGADVVSLGHIHKRDGIYCGALYQNNFGEEGNPQGYELYVFNDKNDIQQSYITLDLPEFKTVEINSDQDVIDFDYQPEKYEYKLRFYSESAFNRADPAILAKCEVERLWNKRKYVARTEQTLTASMSVAELLQSYIKINPIPDGVTEKELLEAIK